MTNRVGIQRAIVQLPEGSIPEILNPSPGNVGGFSAGILRIKSTDTLLNASANITGHNSFGGDRQLWFIGSISSSNDNVGIVNRIAGGELNFLTSQGVKMTIPDEGGLILLGVTGALTLPNMTTGQRDLIVKTNGMMIYNATTNKIQGVEANVWVDLKA